MVNDPLNNYCCGNGGGMQVMPNETERLEHGQFKADQIKASGAELVISPCHNCREQIKNFLGKKCDMGNYKDTKYLWEVIADSLIYEPWSEAEIVGRIRPGMSSSPDSGWNWRRWSKRGFQFPVKHFVKGKVCRMGNAHHTCLYTIKGRDASCLPLFLAGTGNLDSGTLSKYHNIVNLRQTYRREQYEPACRR